MFTSTWCARGGDRSQRAAIARFGGSDREWSPEELLIGAALECLWTTFEALARRAGLVVHDFTGTVFRSMTLAVEVNVDARDEERARSPHDKAERGCIVANALRVPVTVQATMVASLSRAVAT